MSKSSYIPTLDGWRTLSCLAVIIHHGIPEHSFSIVHYGNQGVTFFFFISGFLISTRLLDEREANGVISLRNFYLRRACRILPAALLYLLVICIIAAIGFIAVSKSEVVAAILFARNYVPGSWYTGHYWSLAVEEQFYLVWPLILVLLGIKRSKWLAVFLVISIGVWRAVNNRLHFVENPGLAQFPFDGILWGCFWALILRNDQLRARFSQFVSFPIWVLSIASFALALHFKPLGSSSMIVALIPIIILGTVHHPKSIFGRFLETPIMRWFGRMSYGFYLWQMLFFVSYSFSPRWPIQRFPLNAVALLVCATISYYSIERPMIHFGHRRASRATSLQGTTAESRAYS